MKNKEKVIKKANEILKNLPKEKIQEYSKRAYQNKISK